MKTSRKLITKDRLEDKMDYDFEKAIVDLEALSDYYSETSKLIKSLTLDFKNKYIGALAFAEILDEIYLEKTETRQEHLNAIQDNILFNNITVKDVAKLTLNENSVITYSLNSGYEKFDPIKARRKAYYINNQENIFVRSILSNLIIIYEQFFSSLYQTLVLSEPEKYFEDKQIPICDLLNNDLNKVLTNIVDKEIENNMFDSLKTLDRIKEKSKIDIDRFIPIRHQFEELYHRRNAYVHTEGNVNDVYLKKVNATFTQNIKIGDRLVCDEIYLENAIQTIYKVISSLHFELLRAQNVEQDNYTPLSELGFEALQNHQYQLAEYIYGILRKERDFEYSHKAVYEINYINSLKLQNKNIDELINKFDVSIATDDYKIAKECLLDNYESVYNLLVETYPKTFSAPMIREWPIFINFRKSEFYTKFIEEHKEDFDVFVFEETTSENIANETEVE